MGLNQAVLQLNAAAEPSRLRLLAALLGGETTVGDLVAVLEQSQPRVSRHLRVLAEALLLESFREGRSIYYRWSVPAEASILTAVAALAGGDDQTLARDRVNLEKISRQREREGLRRALRTGRVRGMHASEADAAYADLIRGLLGFRELGDVLHVGCGSADLLRVLLPDSRSAVGTEPSGHRRQVARARLRQAGLPRWTIRNALPTTLPFGAETFDLVIVQDALESATDPQRILGEAARVLRPSGQLLILDRILPTNGELSGQLAALGFVINRRQWLPGRAPDRALFLASRLAPRPQPDLARTGTNA
ncbi:MAG: metalloregulator ArsR/SmtB family transcription factor [Gammaproteobacteria bacterium]|nr:metalloregulator ArsR/SmtB family transcription factor [Gammaproteobacteria bacterium]